MIDTSKFIEGRWLEGGRDWPNIDCYGVVLYVREALGLPSWPRFDGVTKQDDGLHNSGLDFLQGSELCDPCEGAVACCYEASLLRHVGIVVDTPVGLMVVECNPGRHVSLSPVNRFIRRFVRVEFYK